jgi:hypothetical protein
MPEYYSWNYFKKKVFSSAGYYRDTSIIILQPKSASKFSIFLPLRWKTVPPYPTSPDDG